MRVITIQPEPFIDNIWGVKDGGIAFGEKLPYPFHIDADTGEVDDQDFWRGDPARVVGFQNDAEIQRVDVWWRDIAADPELAVGKFPVMVGPSGLYTYTAAIRSVEVREVAPR